MKLRLLIVEDDDAKFGRTQTQLNELMLDTDLDVLRAPDYEIAVQLLTSEYFDVVILDLLIPSMGRPPSIEASKALVSFIEDQRGFNVPLIIGLTAHDDVYDKEQTFFLDRLLMIDRYHPLDNTWAERISEKLFSLVASRKAFLDFFSRNVGIDLIIVAARYGTEFKPIVRAIRWEGRKPKEQPGPGGTTVVRGTAVIGGKSMSTQVVSLGQMGLSTTASVVTMLIERFRPSYMAMLGMCCGFSVDTAAKKSKLLDVCFANSAVCWDEGKYYDDDKKGIEGFSFRPTPAGIDQDTADVLRKFVEEGCGNFAMRAKRLINRSSTSKALKALDGKFSSVPSITSGLNVSGNCIVSRKALIEQIVDRNPAAMSLEMEIFAFLRAVALCDGFRPRVICAKAVADFGEEKDPEIFDPVQPIASELSFVAFDELMRRCLAEL